MIKGVINARLGKSYSLCNKKEIDAIFEAGNKIKSYPFILMYKETDYKETVPFKIVFSAPKRTYRLAVQRNRVKRISREAIRLNKTLLESYLKSENKKLALFLLYTAKTEMSSKQLSDSANELFARLIKQIKK